MSEEQLTTAVAALRQGEAVLQSLLEAEAFGETSWSRRKKRRSVRPRRPNAKSVDVMRGPREDSAVWGPSV